MSERSNSVAHYRYVCSLRDLSIFAQGVAAGRNYRLCSTDDAYLSLCLHSPSAGILFDRFVRGRIMKINGTGVGIISRVPAILIGRGNTVLVANWSANGRMSI